MENRDRILQTALELFTEKGYDSTGVQEIAELSGITKPTLYHYFGSKKGLLEILIEPVFKDFQKGLEKASEYKGDLPRNLTEVTELFFRFARSKPLYARLILSLHFAPAESEARETAAPFLFRQYESINKLFREAVRDHGNMRGRDKAIAAAFLGTLHTYTNHYLNGHTELDDKTLYEAVRLFSYGIYS